MGKAQDIQLICTDVDGTFFNSDNQLTEANKKAMQDAHERGIPTAITTGKSRGPWIDDIASCMPDVPGIFVQGTLLLDKQGDIIDEDAVPQDVIERVLSFKEEHGVTLAAYCGTKIYASETNKYTDIIVEIRETEPQKVDSLHDLLLGDDATKAHKLTFLMAEDQRDDILQKAQDTLGGHITVTASLPGMVEALPKGVNKATGVSKLLKHLKLEGSQMMALGDGDNDKDMLEMAAIGIAMGNGADSLKEAATWVAPSNDEDGFAAAVRKLLNDEF